MNLSTWIVLDNLGQDSRKVGVDDESHGMMRFKSSQVRAWRQEVTDKLLLSLCVGLASLVRLTASVSSMGLKRVRWTVRSATATLVDVAAVVVLTIRETQLVAEDGVVIVVVASAASASLNG